MTLPAVAVIGNGKMGQAVAAVARDAGLPVAAVIDAHTRIDRDSLSGARVAIEFTEPAAAVPNIEACVRAGCPVVVGTTGWYDRLDTVTRFVHDHGGALLWAANFSLGVHLFVELVRYAAELTARVPGFDAHLVETHHTAKKDAPSGTALMLQRAMAPAARRDVPITSVRVGSVPGTHELVLDAAFEQITLCHTARDRRVFAEGAVSAARWLISQDGRRGVFTLDDMLGTALTSAAPVSSPGRTDERVIPPEDGGTFTKQS